MTTPSSPSEDPSQIIATVFRENAAAHDAALRSSAETIRAAADAMRLALREGGKILVFGNGGSAADSQHFAAELVNRFRAERKALAAIALTTDTSILTSVANDADYRQVFARQIEALGRPGDVALGISTSGTSPNVLAAFAEAARQRLTSIALVGARPIVDHVRVCITVPSSSTARVQEVHCTILHALCQLLENDLP